MVSFGFLAAGSAAREGSGVSESCRQGAEPRPGGSALLLLIRGSDHPQSCVGALLLLLGLLCEEREFYTLSLENLAQVFLMLCPVRSLQLWHLEDPKTEISGIWNLYQPAVVGLASQCRNSVTLPGTMALKTQP